MEQVKKAQANLAKVRREEKAKARKEQDHQKYIMGGIIVKYFPEAYEFTEQEMCRIIACAFKNPDIQNMIKAVVKQDFRQRIMEDFMRIGHAENCRKLLLSRHSGFSDPIYYTGKLIIF